jgi:hypothetical protein
MVNYKGRLIRTFAALVAPTGHAQLERKRGSSITELAELTSVGADLHLINPQAAQ